MTAPRKAPPTSPRIRFGGDMDLARQMAPNLRQADLLEIARGTGHTPLEALEASLSGTRNAFWIEHQGRVEAMGGCTPVPGDARVGIPWMLGTDFISEHSNWFLRSTPEIWAIVGHQYERLWNLTDANNTVHLRWLEWSGCQFTGWRLLNGNPFIEFTKSCANQFLSLPLSA